MDVSQRFIELVKIYGKGRFMDDAELSTSTLEKLMANTYPSSLSLKTCRKIERLLGEKINVLFPADQEKESA